MQFLERMINVYFHQNHVEVCFLWVNKPHMSMGHKTLLSKLFIDGFLMWKVKVEAAANMTWMKNSHFQIKLLGDNGLMIYFIQKLATFIALSWVRKYL